MESKEALTRLKEINCDNPGADVLIRIRKNDLLSGVWFRSISGPVEAFIRSRNRPTAALIRLLKTSTVLRIEVINDAGN